MEKFNYRMYSNKCAHSHFLKEKRLPNANTKWLEDSKIVHIVSKNFILRIHKLQGTRGGYQNKYGIYRI